MALLTSTNATEGLDMLNGGQFNFDGQDPGGTNSTTSYSWLSTDGSDVQAYGSGITWSSPGGDPISGTITSLDFDFNNDNFGVPDVEITGFSGSLVAMTTGNNLLTEVFGGNDTINGTGFADTLKGSAGDDTILGGNGADLIYGDQVLEDSVGDGNDTISGGGGNDTILGGNGNDSLFGNLGNDFLRGGAGNDSITGSSGTNTIEHTASDVTAGLGNDTVNGGSGTDTLRMTGAASYDFSGFQLSGLEQLTFVGTDGTFSATFDADEINDGFASGAFVTGDTGASSINRIYIDMDLDLTLDLRDWTFSNWSVADGDEIDIDGDTSSEDFYGSIMADDISGNDGNDDFYVGGAG